MLKKYTAVRMMIKVQSFLFRKDHLFGNTMISCQHLRMGCAEPIKFSRVKKKVLKTSTQFASFVMGRFFLVNTVLTVKGMSNIFG